MFISESQSFPFAVAHTEEKKPGMPFLEGILSGKYAFSRRAEGALLALKIMFSGCLIGTEKVMSEMEG